jgi:lipopolysaccharide transport system permease protein
MQTETSAPVLKIRPPRALSPFAFGEMLHYRDLFWALAVRDVKLRYKQTALGVLWVVLQPLVAAGVMALVFGAVAKLPSDGIPYFIFAYTGMLGWQAFNSTLTKATACVVGNAQLVSKVYFPRLILPLSTVLSTLVDLAVGLVVLSILMAAYGISPGPSLLALPVMLALLILFAVGLGLFTSALMVTYRDLQYAIPYFLQLLMYASPVAFALSAVPENLRILFLINPLTGLLETMRWSILNSGTLNWLPITYSVLAVGATFAVGAVAFKRMERTFADVI